MPRTQTRRLFLSTLAGAAGVAATSPVIPSEAERYPDPATEFEIVRLTSPSHTSVLPAYCCQGVSRHANFLVYMNDRSGSMQVYRMDLKTGESHELTSGARLDTGALTLTPDERTIIYGDGDEVVQEHIGSLHRRTLDRGGAVQSVSISIDGTHVIAVTDEGGRSRIRLISTGRPGASTVLESKDAITDAAPRPKRDSILYRRGGDLMLVNYDGAQKRRLPTAPGRAGPALWSADGRTILYLNFPERGKQLNNIRELNPDTNEERLVSNTTQYVDFARNGDASVFTGASGSKASPYVFLLVRSVRRELTLCEHRASDPSRVSPVFSPNSQRVFFQSDRHGKLAIYMVRVDRLVEQTES